MLNLTQWTAAEIARHLADLDQAASALDETLTFMRVSYGDDTWFRMLAALASSHTLATHLSQRMTVEALITHLGINAALRHCLEARLSQGDEK